MLVNKDDHLALYPATVWAAEEQRLIKKSTLDPAAQKLRRFYASGSVPSPIDSQGRILVPVFLREHAKLEEKVFVAGIYEHIEIWNPSRWAENQADTVDGFDDIQRSVEQASGS